MQLDDGAIQTKEVKEWKGLTWAMEIRKGKSSS